jgi:RNA polymerase sigma-70 factor (ECF subfamily)
VPLTVSTPAPRAVPTVLDPESRDWLARLRATGSERDKAVAELHALLLRAARFEVARRAPAADADDLAHQSADDALVAVLAKLDDFRGASRFTTWAYKFALLEAGVRTRRRLWQERQVTIDSERWELIADRSSGPGEDAETAELLGALRSAIEQELTPHQREVLVAITLNDVPIDVLTEQLDTTRGAVYKTLHDARQKLRLRLAAEGHKV